MVPSTGPEPGHASYSFGGMAGAGQGGLVAGSPSAATRRAVVLFGVIALCAAYGEGALAEGAPRT